MDRLEIIATLQKASNLVNTLNKTAVALTGGLRINSLARELEGYYKISRSKDGLIFLSIIYRLQKLGMIYILGGVVRFSKKIFY